MKNCILLVILLLMCGSPVSADELIRASAREINGNTVISGAPVDGGAVDRAYITLYEDIFESHPVVLQEMEIAGDAITYMLPGRHESIEGKCKLIMLDGPRIITRGKFSLSMR